MHHDDEHDRRLALRAREGDEAAFAELVGRHRAQLVRSVGGRCGRPELAEDAVQEGLLSAHRALRAGQAPRDVRAWLHTIAWRRAIDLARRDRHELSLEAADPVDHAGTPEAVVERAAELDRVVAAWSALPVRQRQALTLSVLEGRSLVEIGTALGLTPDGAKSLVARGRRTLAERLAIADLRCADVRGELLAAAERGVRLGGDVTRHVDGCRSCARLHRQARRSRRLRAAMYAPAGLLVRWDGLRDRVRDLLFTGAGHEPQLSLATKLCAAACVGVMSGPAAAPVTTALPERAVAGAAAAAVAADQLRAPKAAAERKERRPTAAPQFAAAPATQRAATAAPSATTRAAATAPATREVAKSEARTDAASEPQRRSKGRRPSTLTAAAYASPTTKTTTPQTEQQTQQPQGPQAPTPEPPAEPAAPTTPETPAEPTAPAPAPAG